MPKKIRVIKWRAVSSAQQKDNISLEEQDRLLDQLIASHYDWVCVDSLTVDGYSRSDPDILTMLEYHAAQGCYAYHDLRAHWKAKDFDVLVAFDESRVCRSPGGYGWVVSSIIRMGGKVFLLDGGWIDENNEEYGIAFGSMKASSGIKRLHKFRPAGMIKRVEEGKAINVPSFGHKYVYDEKTGKPKQVDVEGFGLSWLVVDESLRPMWDAVLELLEKRVAWDSIEKELAKRGFVDPNTNKPYAVYHFYWTIMSPPFWGHRAYYIKGLPRRLWMLDENEPRPDDPESAKTVIKYGKHPSIWQGEQRRTGLLLIRDKMQIGGHAVQNGHSYPFTGLLICNTCGRNLTVATSGSYGKRKYDRYRCITRISQRVSLDCDQTKTIRIDNIQNYIDQLLRKAIIANDLTFLVGKTNQDVDRNKLKEIDRKLETAKRRRKQLINDQANADLDSHDDYADYIKQESVKIRELTEQRNRLQQTLENLSVGLARERTFREIMENGIDWLWSQDSTTINTFLRRIMGNSRFVVDQGVIIGVVTV